MHDKMAKINLTVNDLMESINIMQEKLDKKISWFSHLLGTTGMYCLIDIDRH